nr:hypothetical protein TSUD_199060 [Ipomoea trifida]GMC58508.1 hypothetical protein TSUD_199060 [Ipomoea batatas]GMD87903.1 hypothetical protein TSUD_199060 [Ipomoea batatas]
MAVTGLVIYSSWVPVIVSSAVRFSVHRHLSQTPSLSTGIKRDNRLKLDNPREAHIIGGRKAVYSFPLLNSASSWKLELGAKGTSNGLLATAKAYTIKLARKPLRTSNGRA